MDYTSLSIILGVISIVLSLTGVFSLLFAIPGLIFSYLALKGVRTKIPFYTVQKNEDTTKFVKEVVSDPKRKLIFLAILLNLSGILITFLIYFIFLPLNYK